MPLTIETFTILATPKLPLPKQKADTSSSSKAVAFIEKFKENYLANVPHDNFDRGVWKSLKVVSATVDASQRAAESKFTVTIPKNHSNHLGIMAGGAVAQLLDGVTTATLPLIGKKGLWDGREVTRSLAIRYYRPVPMEEELEIECEVLDAGSRLATVLGTIRRASDGAVLASCQHDKFYPYAVKL